MTHSKRFFLFFSPSGMPATVCVHLNSVELPRRVEQQNHVTDHPPDVGHHPPTNLLLSYDQLSSSKEAEVHLWGWASTELTTTASAQCYRRAGRHANAAELPACLPDTGSRHQTLRYPLRSCRLLVSVRDHPYITSAYFRTFSDPPIHPTLA